MSQTVIERICQRAKKARKTVILPEAQDARVIQAAAQITSENLASIILLGKQQHVAAKAEQLGVDLTGVTVLDHLADERRDVYVQRLCERRKHKGMTVDQARGLLEHPVYYAGMMVGDARADGMVAGSICPTRDTVRSALFGVGTSPGSKTVSACSIMNTIVEDVGVNGSLIFADTGVVPDPDSEQLAEIAIAAAESCRALLDVEPMVAMLSYSTKGSAKGPAVQKVIDATRIAKSRRSDLILDGELQLDAAIIPHVAERKAGDSPVAGKANVLIFPDLSSGNIGYKLVERLGRASALGPLLQGLQRPVNDLSRGCSVKDIVLVTAITAVQAAGASNRQAAS